MFEITKVPEKWRWLPQNRYGMFIHWGPYAAYGRGEQVLFREHLDPCEYERIACAWNPRFYDPQQWVDIAKRGGINYAVLTSRHHDGYCLWDSAMTDYNSAKQAPGRDFVAEFVDAFRKAGLRVGLYYSLLDWRIPAYFEGPERDPQGWEAMRDYIHTQVEELLTQYGHIDYFWFDGIWPRSAEELRAADLVQRMRALQPHLLINNRLGDQASGDVGTPEHHITAEDRLWESCQVSTWRLWGYTIGERWRSKVKLLDMLCECASKGGNLLLNVGPDADGQLPAPFIERNDAVGDWLKVHGEAVYDTDGGNLTEFVTRGWQTMKDNTLYLIIRFWDGRPDFRLADVTSRVIRVQLLTTGQELNFEQEDEVLIIHDLPKLPPTDLFPVIKISCDGRPSTGQWGKERLWSGDPQRVADWARQRGSTFKAYK